MQAFAERLAREVALPKLSEGYQNLVSTLHNNSELAELARTMPLDELLASDHPAMATLKKSNKELVTDAEKIAEKAMTDAVKAAFPAHAIIGEEHGFTKGSNTRWVFDPVDGTSAMIRTAFSQAFDVPLPAPTPAFGITIALVEGSTPILGLVAELKAGDAGLSIAHVYIGNGSNTHCDGKQITAPAAPNSLQGATLACTVPEVMFGKNKEQWGGFQALQTATGNACLTDQNCIGFMRLLRDVHVTYEADLAYHDAAALLPILLGAGITITDATGTPLSFPESAIGTEFCLLCAAPALHAQALDAIRAGVPDAQNSYQPRADIHQGYASKFS